MDHHFQLVIVIPCFNEGKRLIHNEWFDYIQAHPQFLFLFVNDGSIDDTSGILKSFASKHTNIEILHNSKNCGKSGAVRNGILHAHNYFQFDAIAFIDADLSTPLTELDRFLSILYSHESTDFLLGSRVQMLGKRIKRNLFRHYIGRGIATLICKILDEPVYDTQCGLKMLKRSVAIELVRDQFITRWLFDVEMLARYKTKYGSVSFNTRLLEVPVLKWTEKDNSKLKYYQFVNIIQELLKINRHYFRILRS